MKYKVKIALAVDSSGDWNASGWGNVIKGTGDPEESMNITVDTLLSGEKRYFVEVEIELPSTEILKGNIIPD